MEILIHIGAPSRAVDDERYRSLAAAYMAFEPTEIVPISSQSSHDYSKQHDNLPQQWIAGDGDRRTTSLHDFAGSFESPQASFRSVVDNADSPRMRMRHAVSQQIPISFTQASSWQTPPSVVQDSHPMNHTEFPSLNSPTRVLEHYLQDFESPLGSSKHEPQSSDRPVAPTGHNSQHESHRSSPRAVVPDTPQMIPCTPWVKNVESEPASKGGKGPGNQNKIALKKLQVSPAHDDGPDNEIVEETRFLSSSELSSLTRAGSEPGPQSRRLDSLTSPHPLARASSEINPRSSFLSKTPVGFSFLSSHGYTYESLEIRAPDPPTSEPHIEPQDLITRALQKLGRDVGLPARFRPKVQRRALRPFERGYWLLDASSWDPRLKHDAWAFLANYIGTGEAGWGVWCRRDSDFGGLRMYCWGSIVPHIYYLLWLSSQGEISFMGSSWVDADGAEIIVMGTRHGS